MGAALYITLEKEIPGIDAASIDGKVLCQEQKNLDKLCKQSDLRTLSSFISNSNEQAEEFLPTWLLKFFPAKEAWFDSKDGLKTILFLKEKVSQRQGTEESNENLILDLEAAAAILKSAEEKSIRFHFSVDY